MKEHKAAVLLATYNGSTYIREFLESLVEQEYAGFTLFVRDDGSTDDTLEIVRSFSSKIEIVLIKSNSRLGPAKSFFELLASAGSGFDFYFFADQDDYWDSSKIQRAVDHLKNKSDLVVLYCSRLEYVDDHLIHIKYSRIPKVISLENALVENIAAGCTIAFTKSTRRLILENPPDSIMMHDWWLYIVVAAFGEVVYDRFPTIKYRQHGNNTVGAATNTFQDFKRRLSRFLKREGGIFGLAMQAMEFKRCFSDLLPKKQLELVNSLIGAKSSFINRLRLVFSSIFIRQRLVDNLILRILFLIGRF